MKITKRATNHGDYRERAEAAERERDKARAVADRLLEQRDAATAEALKLRRSYETAVKVGSGCIADFVNLQAEADKLAERRDRWRKRAETAADLSVADLAKARSKALTEAARTLARDGAALAGTFRDGIAHSVSRLLEMAEAQKRRGPIEAPEPTPGVDSDAAERVFKSCGYKPMETDSAEILRAILRTAEGIRADLQRARDARRV